MKYDELLKAERGRRPVRCPDGIGRIEEAGPDASAVILIAPPDRPDIVEATILYRNEAIFPTPFNPILEVTVWIDLGDDHVTVHVIREFTEHKVYFARPEHGARMLELLKNVEREGRCRVTIFGGQRGQITTVGFAAELLDPEE